MEPIQQKPNQLSIVRRELRKITSSAGKLTPEEVVNAARPDDHPLHRYFDWDDTAAAEKYRLYQARGLIRSVHIIYQVGHVRIRTVEIIRDPDVPAGQQGYRLVRNIQSDRAAARDAVLAEFARIESSLKRARDLAIVLGFSDQIDREVQRIVHLGAQIMAGTPTDRKGTVYRTGGKKPKRSRKARGQ